jgi:hypothetical protein
VGKQKDNSFFLPECFQYGLYGRNSEERNPWNFDCGTRQALARTVTSTSCGTIREEDINYNHPGGRLMKNTIITLLTIFITTFASIGNANVVIILPTKAVQSKSVFTKSMLIEKVMQINYTSEGRIFSFTESGEALQFEKVRNAWSVISVGKWKINRNGTVTISTPAETITIIIEKDITDDKIGKFYTASCFDSKTPTVVKGPLALLIR